MPGDDVLRARRARLASPYYYRYYEHLDERYYEHIGEHYQVEIPQSRGDEILGLPLREMRDLASSWVG